MLDRHSIGLSVSLERHANRPMLQPSLRSNLGLGLAIHAGGLAGLAFQTTHIRPGCEAGCGRISRIQRPEG